MEQMEVEKDESIKGVIQTQLEESLKGLRTVEDGQLTVGTVVQVTNDYVFVDIGYKSEGRIPAQEFAGKLPKDGEELNVVVLKKDGRNGPEISFTKAMAKQLWKDLRKAFDEKLPVEGLIEKSVKGGFEVNLGGDIRAFLPISQSDSQKVDSPEKLIGLKTKFYIERLYSENKANVVVNRRKYLEEGIEIAREKFFAETQIGATVKGVVKSFTSFGAFIDLGGFDGLLHINDMSWGHVTRPKDFVKKGQEIELKVIRLTPEEKKINLSLKHFSEDPWLHFEDKYNVNAIVDGVVTKITDFGAFIELEEGIEGLAHISEFSWTKNISKVSDVVKIGDKIKCMVLGYDIQAGRVSLGLKQVTENPWDSIADKYPVDSKLHGKVVKVTKEGAFVQIEEGIDGYLRSSDISWTKKVKNAASELQVDQEVDVVVLSIDGNSHKISLGMKQLTENPWEAFAKDFKVGSTFEGEVTTIKDFGIFVKAPNGVEGLVSKSNLVDSRESSCEEALKKYNIGDKVNVYVIDIDVKEQRVAFSVKEYKKAQANKEISQYMASSEDSDEGFTFGDFVKSKESN